MPAAADAYLHEPGASSQEEPNWIYNERVQEETDSMKFEPFIAWLRRQKILSLALVLFTLALGMVIGTVITRNVGARDQVVAPGATPLAIPAPAQLSSAFVQIAKSVSPSVVNINTQSTIKHPRAGQRRAVPRQRGETDPFEDFFDRFFEGPGGPEGDVRQRSLGSGIVVSKEGYIVTNRHVVEKADRIQVKVMNDATQYDAKVIGSDGETDIAVIKITPKQPLIAARMGNSEGISVGDWVLAVGSPFGLAETVTAGIISARGRDLPGAGQFQHFLQTDAAINPGNSGGPLVSMAGEVIGVNTAIITQRGTYEGVGFALPSNTAIQVYNQIIKSGRVSRGSIGVEFQSDAAQNPALLRSFGVKEGVVITNVRPDAPADKAGLKSGDVIVAVDGAPIKSGNDLVGRISETPVGNTIRIRYNRNGKEAETAVTVGDRSKIFEDLLGEAEEAARPGETTNAKFGLTLQNLTPEMADRLGIRDQQGVIVNQVDPGSFADDIGVARGDLIVEIQRQPVRTVEDVRRIQGVMKSGDAVVFKVMRRVRGPQMQAFFLAGDLP